MSDKVIQVKATEEIIESLSEFTEQFPQAVADALWSECQIIMNQSKEQCPVDTGRLRASGEVSEPVVEPGKVEVSLGYGTDYAIYVHEDLEKYHAPPTKAKFLEDPISERSDVLLENVVKRVTDLIEE